VTSDLEKKLGQGQGHPPFWAKIQIFNSFIKANFEVLNWFLSISAHYIGDRKKKKEKKFLPIRDLNPRRLGHGKWPHYTSKSYMMY
jgi:hypothetical protein